MTDISDREKTRYDRQMIISDWGEEGQERIKDTKALIAGVGGLGSPVSIYLAAAGVGELKIVDSDDLELSNLNRQILYDEGDIGERKALSAAKSLREINSDIKITPVDEKITEKSIENIAESCDVLVDCMDNFSGRYVLNKFAYEEGIPLFHAAVEGMDGQATTIIPSETPCLKCVFPNSPPSTKVSVLGATPGLLGSIQAHEVLKYVVGIGDLLKNELLIVKGGTDFEKVPIEKNASCEICGEQ